MTTRAAAGVAAALGLAYGAYSMTTSSVTAQSKMETAGQPTKKAMVRRHSSGDHAFLPVKREREAVKISQQSFGVQSTSVPDSEGDRLPTTRGY
mmetsp:Transcript_28743/g.47634  ORF Transcript_28743/g.47634 Transcript_28743/m.47634 type:complete len:94 (+) Transcript_28743:83-364(+)|eukprot:CAMPEP_0119302336 /NCGR_PEP_ID=MMETSP1333-20130426/3943_1 /TAXON_ID=418940 /ORGANISM="Scyphosphaera apsteinii, Strain RCC1455" /LENGTH=93 /DNA_ID=CAMNT_0007304661 /DNA_START=59 /DNA_END=340 /DNA_ORIENTATION=-